MKDLTVLPPAREYLHLCVDENILEDKSMGWEKLIDTLDESETEVEYDGYFCSIQDAVIIVTLASLCELKA